MKRTILMILAGLVLAGCASRADRDRPDRSRPDAAALSARANGQRRIGLPRRASADLMAAEADVGPDEHPNEPRKIDRTSSRLSPMALDGDLGAPVYFGLMHAHSFISDGSGTPAQAFAQAKAAGLDFFALTPHNHAGAEQGAKFERKDGVLIATTPALYDSPNSVHVTRRFESSDGDSHEVEVDTASLRSAAGAATTSNFVAIYGQEFSTISSGNHANVFQPAAVISTIPNGAYRELYEQFGPGAAAVSTVVQFNHPDVQQDLFYNGSDPKTLKTTFNDYGYDEYEEDFSQLVAAALPVAALIEVLSGPATDESTHPSYHYSGYQLHENDYYFYLVQGFHLSPSAGQDNHFETWGDSTPARMGVYASARTAPAILAAMRMNRTYATEDSDLVLDFSCNGQPMGSTLSLSAGDTIHCEVGVADPTDGSGAVTVDLFYGDVQPARDRASLVEWKPSDGKTETLNFDPPATVAFEEYQASGKPEFFYVRVKQADSDRAWSAPIWFNHPRNR